MMGSMMRRAMIGDSATLNVDFTSMTNGGQLANAGFTFTNATTTARTYINSSGLVATATTNEPRFDHDPTTLAPRGLLIEGSATNLLPNSQTLSGTGWFTGGICTRTSNYATGPDGIANSATRLEMSFSGGVGRTYYDSGYTTLPQTMSVWLKSNTGSNQTVNLWNTSGTPVSCTVTPTWQRFQSVSTTGSSLPGYFYFENPSTTVAVDILAWGAQLEAGSGASSYIPTGASTVQRLADNCSIVSPNFAPWYGSPTGWTVVAEMTPQSRVAGSFPGMLALRSAADSGLRIYYYNDGTYNTAFRFATASTNAEVFGPNGVTYGVPRKFGASVTSGTQFASSAGVQIGSTQTLAVPMDQTLLAIGSDGVSPTPAINCRMHFRSIKYWPYAMTLADLNARTT